MYDWMAHQGNSKKVCEGISMLPGMMTHLLLKKYKRHWTQYSLSRCSPDIIINFCSGKDVIVKLSSDGISD